MKASELRIGNFIGSNLEEYPNNFFRVLEPAETSMKVTDNIAYPSHTRVTLHYFDPEDMEGIPLTEEWLLKFGFEDQHGYMYPSYRKGLLLVYGCDNGKWIYIVGKSLHSYESDKKDLYVHQLQNLYFALTGEELTINKNL